jgi:CubicO group peptidase (beta-lactamase class C family)
MIVSLRTKAAAGRPNARRSTIGRFTGLLLSLAAAGSVAGTQSAAAAEAPGAAVETFIPALEAYIEKGMQAYGMPGLAIGIVAGDKLVYAEGFGVRGDDGEPVDPRTVFQIASTTKAFLAATMAIMVDRGRLDWRDRVTALCAEFKLKDPEATRKFRFLDLVAQRSGMPTSANDVLGFYGYDADALIRSLRHVETTSTFPTTFSYTNITHILAGRIVADAAGSADWNEVLQQELLGPLGMRHSSFSAKALKDEPNHAQPHRWTPGKTAQMRLTQIFPYDFSAAGDINSNIEDMAHWLRLQLANGRFEGRRIVSAKNLGVTREPRVKLTDALSYAMGWYVFQSPGGSFLWHDGDSHGFGSFVGLATTKDVGVVVLTNTQNVGLPAAIGRWVLDRVLGNPDVDHVEASLKDAVEHYEARKKLFARPEQPKPSPKLGSLTGHVTNSSFGNAAIVRDGDGLILELGTGARLGLEPWDGPVFTARLLPEGGFGPMARGLGPLPAGFAEFLTETDGGLVLSMANGQKYRFERR